MAYNKPDVEITQVQRSVSPVLITPDLEAVVVGNGYWWQDITWDNPDDTLRHSVSPSNIVEDAGALVLALSGINTTYYDVEGDEQLTLVDLVGISGPETGNTSHLIYGQDFSVASNVLTVSGLASGAADPSTYQVKVGYRAKNTGATGYNIISQLSDIESLVGEPVSWNPLAFGAMICQINAGTRVNILGVEWAASPGTKTIDAINTTLPLKEVYSIAPVTHNVTGAGLKTHCDTWSAATGKKERIAFYNKEIAYGGDPELLTTAEKATVAGVIRDANSALGAKRLFSVHPDLAFVQETRHVSTVKPSWIAQSFDYFTTIELGTYGPFARFTTDVNIGNIRYKAGQEITETIWTALIAAGWGGSLGMVTVFAPVPGFYYNAQTTGQVIGTPPEQPLTNVPGAGLVQTYGSQDLFSETELNTMAAGGTYIMTQGSEAEPIVSRHQMSTDITSIAKRELSITKALDYVAKFYRIALRPFIGRYNITADFLKFVNSILVGGGLYLVRIGAVDSIKVLSVVQDDVELDTVKAEIEVLPKYPVNYIRITLIF